MARSRMGQLVNWGDGQLCTPRQALDRGIAEVRVVERFAATGKSKPRRAVFVDLVGAMRGVEVSGYVRNELAR